MLQFTLRQLMWGTALAAAYSCALAVALKLEPGPNLAVVFLATGSALGGLIGLRRNNVSAMVLGVLAGFIITLVACLLFLPAHGRS